MADTKISALTALAGSAVASADLFAIVDTSATTTKSLRFDELLTAITASQTYLTVAGGDVVPDTWTIKITGDAAKSNPIPILEFADLTTNISPQSAWLQIWAADNASDVGLRAMTTPGTNHAPLTMFPKGTDGFRVKWDSSPSFTPSMELANVSSGVSAGQAPYYYVSHYPASPSANMFVGGMFCASYDSAANATEYLGINGIATNVTNGAEEATWEFQATSAGVQYTRIGSFGSQGLIVGTSSSYPGLGSIRYSGNLYGSGSQGDIMYHDGTKFVNLSPGASGNFLKTNGAGANPSWAAAGITEPFTFTRKVTITEGTANESILASTGYSLTGANAQSMIDFAGTWNTSGNPIALKIAITNTASGSTSKFASFLAGASGTTEFFSVDKAGNINFGNNSTFVAQLTGINSADIEIKPANTSVCYIATGSGAGVGMRSNSNLNWTDNSSSSINNRDTFIGRAAAANVRHGDADAASPVAQTLSVQNVVAGTSNTAGVDFTISGSRGTGTGAGGDIVLKTAPAGGSGTSQNALAEVLRVLSAGNIKFTNAANFTANATTATTLGSVGPAGANTTVQEWLTFKNAAGTTRYVPCF